MHHIRQVASHGALALAEAGIIAILILTLMVAPTLAAKGGANSGGGKAGGSTSTLALVLMDGASEAKHLGRVTFEVSTTATDRPFVGLRCWQNGTWMYDSYVGYFEDYMYEDNWFRLDSPYWNAGVETSCTGRLFYYDKRGNQKVLATADFLVAP